MINIQTLPKDSRVWIYQSSREFTPSEVEEIKPALNQFAKDWTSHNQQLKAQGDIFLNRFVVLMVDQSLAGPSGCSIDKSVKFIQSIEHTYGVDMFDRMSFAYEKDGEVKTAHRESFKELYHRGIITDDTIVFNNLVETVGDFENSWKVRLGSSWHKKLVGAA